MSRSTTSMPTQETDLIAMPIRDLVEIDPRTMEILAPLGIDLCCGGAHPLGEALDLHGIERGPIVQQLLDLARGSEA